MSQDSVYAFWKVEDFFAGHKLWNYISDVTSYKFHKDLLSLEINAVGFKEKKAGETRNFVVEIQFWSASIYRVRFDPAIEKFEQYPRTRSRAIVKTQETVDVAFKDTKDAAKTVYLDTNRLQVKVNVDGKLRIFTSWKLSTGVSLLFQTSNLLFTPNGPKNWHVIQSAVKPPTARYIGFGEQGGQNLIKNEEQVTYFNYDNMRYRQVYNKGPLEPKEPMYHSEPFFIEFNGVPAASHLYGLFVDNPGQVLLDVGWEHSEHILIGTRFGGLDYYLITAEHVRHVTTGYSSLVGTAHLKPRYALGYHQGCYGYDTQDKVVKCATDHRAQGIPLDGIHVDVDIQKNYHTFTIDTDKFRDAKGMFGYLRQLGVKCSTNITPIISNRDYAGDYITYQEGVKNNYFVLDKRVPSNVSQYQDFSNNSNIDDRENNINSGKAYIGEVYYGGDPPNERGTTGHYPNFAHQAVRDWWGKQYTFLFEQGLEFVWQDMTTPAIRPTRGDMRSFPFRLLLDNNWLTGNKSPGKDDVTEAIKIWNLYSFNLHQATFRGLLALPNRHNTRPFIIGRGAFAGVHRYAGLWAGDNSSSWDFFQMNVYQALALGICSMSVNGQDIGGFEPEGDQQWCDPQLLVRWTAAGAFLPWFRNHYNAKGSKKFQEPYNYKYINLDEAHVPEYYRRYYRAVYPACQYYIKLRYRLLQVFYDALFENQFDGLPISRALILNDCDRTLFSDKARFLNDEFFLREDLLIAPILHPEENGGGGKRDIYLPTNNNWFLFVDNKKPLSPLYRGGNTIRGFDASINDDPEHIPFIVPILVRGGAIVPTLEQEYYVGELNHKGLPNPLTFNIYPGALRTMYYKLYLDDGISRDSAPDKDDAAEAAKTHSHSPLPGETGYNYDSQMILEQNCVFPQNPDKAAKAKYRRTLITHLPDDKDTGSISVTFEREHDGYTPKYETFFYVALLHAAEEIEDPLASISIVRDKAKPVDITKIQLPSVGETAGAISTSTTDAWYYNPNVRISFVKVFDNAVKISITATRK